MTILSTFLIAKLKGQSNSLTDNVRGVSITEPGVGYGGAKLKGQYNYLTDNVRGVSIPKPGVGYGDAPDPTVSLALYESTAPENKQISHILHKK